MKFWINKYYKVIVSAISFVINTIGLVLSIYSAVNSGNISASETYITFLLVSAEVFLIISVIYTIFSALSNYHNKISVDEKDAELIRCKEANKVILENTKAITAYYKDFKDRLNVAIEQHLQSIEKVHHFEEGLRINSLPCRSSQKFYRDYISKNKKEIDEKLKQELVELYNRFIINIITHLRENIEEYLVTKGCNASVSIALKQLESPEKYTKLDDKKKNIHTAFRDAKTYRTKTRNETWQKSFCISKNSDFKFSIERDYYIFNFVDKTLFENGFYLNENNNFYENYNSGVTCAIYSCIDKERVLYGFLACDSLLDKKMESKCGHDIYDYNVANIMMFAANIIALYLTDFLRIWDKYYIEEGYYEDLNKISLEEQKRERNLCQVMIRRAMNTRYSG